MVVPHVQATVGVLMVSHVKQGPTTVLIATQQLEHASGVILGLQWLIMLALPAQAISTVSLVSPALLALKTARPVHQQLVTAPNASRLMVFLLMDHVSTVITTNGVLDQQDVK